ncbi:CRE-DCAP-1 protein [Caenorhabditis remanei]|uniref:CRE-DCAP-1 protein n=1 Tax=Caenorhabditis remanei TaxID=31234 RepID=E3NEU4_CAERE|nr:CRE-DCAP-1 protein [Caenorhabditis remanei]
MSDPKKKAAAELAAKNLQQLQKIDIAASKILDKMPFTAIYRIDPVKKEWRNADCEGTLFVYQRADRPYFSFLIANRNDPTDFIEPLTLNHILRLEGNFIYFQKDKSSIQALWFHEATDTQRIYNLLQKLVDKLKASTTEQARAASAAGGAATKASAPVPTSAPAPSKTIDLLQMIKSAQSQSNSVNVTPAITAPVTTPAPAPEQMPALLQKLMFKEPGTAMSADELEKDLLKTAKPHRNHLLQDFTNSPSAISLAAISTRSVHGSEGDQDVDVAEGEVLEPLDTSFVVGSGGQTPVLNKEQFISAIAHLMQNDDEFVAQIHQAYIGALNRRLNID